jgi:L-aminopeptidase/D-esterase-like protein
MRARWSRAALLAASIAVGVTPSGDAQPRQASPQSQPQVASNATLTAVPGIKVGHHALSERPTGCTVILTEAGVMAGVDVRGGAPGTRETALLHPANSAQVVHGIALAGGSAFGLDTASGVMRYLDERNIGVKLGTANIPIVPAAILIDLWVGGKPKIRPSADCGYQAARDATTAPVVEGSVGAGAGATLGKIAGRERAMKGGLGSAAITTPDGLIVAAIVAVNARGDVIDPATGKVVAGVRTPDGKALADARVMLRAGGAARATIPSGTSKSGENENTTIGVIATNARLTKADATKVAQMAHDGYARAISPVHTPADGDTIFTLATGTQTGAGEPDIELIGALAAEAMADAIVRAARQATGLPGIPAIRDLKP